MQHGIGTSEMNQGIRLEGHAKNTFGKRLLKCIKRDYWLYLFILPTLIYYLIFHYAPMGGVVIAFKRYTGLQSIWESRWVGLKWFKSFFNSFYASTTIRNTILLSVGNLLIFPIPIIFALLVNELRNQKFKKVAQTVTYAPHFVSTVVLVSMLSIFFNPNYGFVNTVVEYFGGERRDYMTESESFRALYVLSSLWQNMGWDAIIYIAALSSVDPGLHEAASIDGASRFQRMIHVNLPAIMPTIVITLILAVGRVMSVGADKVLLMRNDLNSETAEIISTYVYNRGLLSGDYSYAAAVGLFTNVVNLILLLSVNKISKKVSDTSLF